MNNVYIRSNGCAVLMHETERIAKYFILNGWNIVKNPSEAQFIVMTCCGVTHNEEDEAISIIKDIENQRTVDSHYIISGCMPAFAGERVKRVSPTAIILTYNELPMLDRMISAIIPFSSVYYNVGSLLNREEDKQTIDEDLCLMRKIDKRHGTDICEKAWAFSTLRNYMWQNENTYQIKVSYGCPGQCSYCATKLGIGNFRSIDSHNVMKQFNEGLDKGYTHFLLIGDEIGSYGCDIGTSLPDLLHKMNSESNGQASISIRYIHPDVFVKIFERMKSFFASGFVNYFCCAIQSGSAEVLRRMNRNPQLEPFIRCMEEMNSLKYPVNKHTQIIIGFPGETANDLLLTMDALRRCQFDHININLYSPRKHTRAWLMTDDISNEEKMFRAELIRYTMKLYKKAILYDAIKQVEST